MRRTERVVFAFAALGEPRKPAALPQGTDAVATAGEYFVRIGLMPDVPDQAILGRVEYVMQRHSQLDDAQPCAEVASGNRNGVNGFLTQLVRKLAQLTRFQPA